jgi:parallel beta-helix repeat protein
VTQNNVITGVAQGVTLDGDSGQVVGNRIYGGARGISGSADGIVVKGNDVRHQAQEGIFVQGTFPTVQGNKVYGADLGIVAHCTTCFGGSIASNVITDTSSYGILASADDVGLVVQGNTLLRTGQGISVAGFGPTVRLNKATDVGADIEGNCIEVFSDRGTVARNTATRCSAAGVYVRGNEMWVDRNVVSGTFENGLTVDGFDPGDPPTQGTVLAANRATGNSGQGIAIIGGAVDTRVAGNTASGNRLDFCFDGSGLTLADNKFGTLANTPGTDCVIAH